MTTKQMIQGVRELQDGTIPAECLIDMAPLIINMLTRLMALEDNLLVVNTEKDYTSLASYLMIKSILSINPSDEYFNFKLKQALGKQYGKMINSHAVN